MRDKLIILWGVMLLAACGWLLIKQSLVREGVPQIQETVRQELGSLSRSTEALRSLHLNGLTRTYAAGSGVSMTGYFQFDGDYSNNPCRVYATWRNADTNAPIDKIEVSGISKELKTIWSRK